jgi:hypothetical protein
MTDSFALFGVRSVRKSEGVMELTIQAIGKKMVKAFTEPKGDSKVLLR